MQRKEYVVLWSLRPNKLASTKPDHARLFMNGREIQHVIIRRPGYQEVEAGTVLASPYNGITFPGITDWFRAMNCVNRRRYFAFSSEYDRQTRSVILTYLG